MKKKLFILGFLLIVSVEIFVLIFFSLQPPTQVQDTITVNEIMQSVTQNFNSLDSYENSSNRDYVIINTKEEILYKTKSGLSETINEAIAHRDTILDIVVDGMVLGKLILYNDGAQTFQEQRNIVIVVFLVSIILQCALMMGYGFYIQSTIIKPFKKLKGFAERIAGGNLDIPLEMDKQNVFGAFTESFDIMRTELKKAKIAEAQANASKKELVAKLSHDIKTPVASIKAVSEVGLALSVQDKNKKNYEQIIHKADQINTLVSNLFTATLEELEQLTVSPTHIESKELKVMLQNADYQNRAAIPDVPECLIYVDRLRLQQVFDNIFANSYKYAKTDISVAIQKKDNCISISIEDFGGGVSEEELPLLKEKFKRGSNSANIEGAGLGLYISDYFMKEMQGQLEIENGQYGLKVTVTISLSGK